MEDISESLYNERMLFNPTSKNLVKDMSGYKEFAVDFGLNRQKVLKYIILAYDMNSPLRDIYMDIWERKRAAAIAAGFKTGRDGRFEAAVEDMLVGENKAVNIAVAKYITLHGLPEYTAMIAYQTGLHLEMLKVQNGNITQNITKNINLLNSYLNEVTEYIFGGKDVVNVRQALYAMSEHDRFPLPDDVVRRIAAGDMLDDYNPYKNYKVDELRFIGDE